MSRSVKRLRMRRTSQTRAFWGTALTVFLVLRLADVLNAVTGLWVVPMGVTSADLGALLPLTSFGAFLALPVTILSTVFVRQLCTYVVSGDTLRARGLLRDVFGMTLVVLLLAVAVAMLCLPRLCQFLRVPYTPAGYLAVTYGLLAAFLPLALSALQATKRFGTLALGSALAAPARLMVMLLLLPLCGLSGYFLGQITPLLVTLCVALWVLRPYLAGREPCPFGVWRNDLLPMTRYAACVALGAIAGAIQGLTLSFVIRHMLPESDSAGYYLVSRFAEIATYCGSTLWMVLFPFAVEAKTRGETSGGLRNGVVYAILLGGGLLAGAFYFLLPPLFTFLPGYDTFLPYIPHAVYLTLITTLTAACGSHFQHATARNDFHYFLYTLPITGGTLVALLFFPWENLLQVLHLLAISNGVQFLCVLLDMHRKDGARQRQTLACE